MTKAGRGGYSVSRTLIMTVYSMSLQLRAVYIGWIYD